MSGWRNIVVGGAEFRWRGTYHIVIQNVFGKRISHPNLTAPELKGISQETFARGRWKRTMDGMIKPHHIAAYIEKTLTPRRCM
jgi:hypothetical protein